MWFCLYLFFDIYLAYYSFRMWRFLFKGLAYNFKPIRFSLIPLLVSFNSCTLLFLILHDILLYHNNFLSSMFILFLLLLFYLF